MPQTRRCARSSGAEAKPDGLIRALVPESRLTLRINLIRKRARIGAKRPPRLFSLASTSGLETQSGPSPCHPAFEVSGGPPTTGTNLPYPEAILLPNLFFPFTICSSPFTPSHFPIPAPAPHAILPPSLLREPGPDRRSGRATAASPSGSVPEACEGPRQAGALRNPLPTSLSGDGAQGAEKPREGF